MEGKGAEIGRHDFAKDAPTRAQLEAWIDESNLGAALNTRSPKFKELGLKDKTLTKKQAIDLMMQDVNLIRRPVVVKGKKIVFGFDADGYEKMI